MSSTSILNNFNGPGVAASASMADRLAAGGPGYPSQPIVVAQSGLLARGTVLGLLASGKYGASDPAASNGLQYPLAILGDICDATAADANSGAFFFGEFNADGLNYGAWGLPALTAALKTVGVFVKVVPTALTNADPS